MRENNQKFELNLEKLAHMVASFFEIENSIDLYKRIEEFRHVLQYWFNIEASEVDEFISNNLLQNYRVEYGSEDYALLPEEQFEHNTAIVESIDEPQIVYDENNIPYNLIYKILTSYKRQNRAVEFLLCYIDDIQEIEPVSRGGMLLHCIVRSKCSHTAIGTILRYDNININALDTKLNTPLHIALMQSNNKAAEQILAHYTSAENCSLKINSANKAGNTPLHIALMKGNIALIKLILQYHCVDIHITNFKNLSPFLLSIKKLNYVALELLIKHKNFHIDKFNLDAGALLCETLHLRKLSYLNLLLSVKGININTMNHLQTSALYLATYMKDIEFMERLIQHPSIDVNFKNGSSNNNLYWFNSVKDNVNTALLMHSKINSEALSEEGDTPLHLACREYNKPAIFLLLQYGAKLNIRNNSLQTPLNLLLKNLNLKSGKCIIVNKMKFLVGVVASSANYITQHFNNVIFLFNYILKRAHQINSIYKVIEVSIEYEKQYNLQLNTSSDIYLREWNSVMGLLILHTLVRMKTQSIQWVCNALEYLFEKLPNLEIDAKDIKGLTPLIYANKNAKMKFVNFLIQSGANPNIRLYKADGNLYTTLLHKACYKVELPTVSIILQSKAAVNAQDYNGCSALQCTFEQYFLHKGVSYGYKKQNFIRALIIKELILHGANPNLPANDIIKNMLFFACTQNDFMIVDFLLKSSKLDIEYKDKDGNTCLHIACLQSNISIIRILLKHGADINACNIFNTSALSLFRKLQSDEAKSGNISEINALKRMEETYFEQSLGAHCI